jgi:hypothetical protein
LHFYFSSQIQALVSAKLYKVNQCFEKCELSRMSDFAAQQLLSNGKGKLKKNIALKLAKLL